MLDVILCCNLLELKDTRYNSGWGEGGERGGGNNFKLGSVLIYGSTILAVLDPGLFVLCSDVCRATELFVLSYMGLPFDPILSLHCEFPSLVPSVQCGLSHVAQVCVRGLQ